MKVFKLLLASALSALALAGLTAASAHAVKSEWMIEHLALAEQEVKEEKVSVTGGPITLSVPSKEIVLECQQAEGTGKILQGGSDEATISLTECEVVGVPACQVSGSIKLEVKSQLILAGGYYRKIEPLTEGKPITTIAFKEGTGCALPLKTEVKGNVAAEISMEELASQPQTFSEGISNTVNKGLKEAGEAELKLTYGISTAFLTGKLETELTGENAENEFYQAALTKLCDTAPVNGACPNGKAWPAKTMLRAEHEATVATKFKIGVASFQCSFSVLGGPTSEIEGAPLKGTIETAAFTGCNGGCEVAVLELPYEVHYEARGATGHGAFTLFNPKFEMECPGGTCFYGGNPPFQHLSLQLLQGGNPAMLKSAPVGMTKLAGSAGGCLATGLWEGTTPTFGTIKYQFELPAGELYVTG